jgi:hypothetical protein
LDPSPSAAAVAAATTTTTVKQEQYSNNSSSNNNIKIKPSNKSNINNMAEEAKDTTKA